MIKEVQSDLLFAQPAYASGIGSVIDLWGQLTEYNSSESGNVADGKAIAADWCVVGQDIFDAVQGYASLK